jgi:single-strand DNA-binding protein
MSDMNQVWLSGRLTRAPELRKTPSGVAVCDFSIASNRYSKRPDATGKPQQLTTFTKVTVWNKAAEVLSGKLNTGDTVQVLGYLVDDNFEQKDGSGKTSGRLKIKAVQVSLVNKASKHAEEPSETEPVFEDSES